MDEIDPLTYETKCQEDYEKDKSWIQPLVTLFYTWRWGIRQTEDFVQEWLSERVYPLGTIFIHCFWLE